jgi:hypothetical protein
VETCSVIPLLSVVSSRIASPAFFTFAAYRVRRALERHAQEKLKPPATKAARRTYFYPTQELDGNGTDYHRTDA